MIGSGEVLTDKTGRILQMYDMFLSGEEFTKTGLAERYGVSEKSVQRDISYFMNTGEQAYVKFRFWGKSIEAVKDRLPKVRILSQNGNEYILQARIYTKGMKMWFLSQAEFLEVLEPESFREEMKKTIASMLANYGGK